MQKPKYQKIRTWFNLKAAPRKPFKINGQVFKSLTVRPFNGETTTKHPRNVSWSHGFTHFEIRETATVGFCGTSYFENNATALKKTPKA